MKKIDMNSAALKSARIIADAEPYFVDVVRAGDFLEGFDSHTILHSGPPIEYERMCSLHKRGMVNGVLFEGLAKTEEEAERIESVTEQDVVNCCRHITPDTVYFMYGKGEQGDEDE